MVKEKCEKHPDRDVHTQGMCSTCSSSYYKKRREAKASSKSPPPKDASIVKELLVRERDMMAAELVKTNPKAWTRYWECVGALVKL